MTCFICHGSRYVPDWSWDATQGLSDIGVSGPALKECEACKNDYKALDSTFASEPPNQQGGL